MELSHLTVRQYRNSVADIVSSFRTPVKLDDKQGLRGEYYNSRGFQGNKRAIDRVDAEVKFDFHTEGPKSEKELKEPFDPHQFSIRWEGSVLTPETGLYEFVVRTDHALRLWVNDPKTPAIDAWVKSGSDTEFRKRACFCSPAGCIRSSWNSRRRSRAWTTRTRRRSRHPSPRSSH